LRAAEWAPAASSARSAAKFVIDEPEHGYVALVGEATFGSRRRAFTLSTSLTVLAAADEPPYGTQALGREGVCAGLESAPIVTLP
jgi:hypothetical protein